ncbi:transcription elongation regulator 1-like protein [Bufo gargarizans]|uniref:transcription elongation regulator 1-like protein n=1 Tax=Bufo gargarizans TaxID=30331 RepID=UPI001CF335AE|nr:transcription elongation regulator 1-like protein [Bufo gargarizans]
MNSKEYENILQENIRAVIHDLKLKKQSDATRKLPKAHNKYMKQWFEKEKDKSKEANRATCSTAFILHSERKNNAAKTDEKNNVLKMSSEEDCVAKINKPVASTPVPGSPWCVVWTGDDKVFFFNPTIQLSVWDKPIDLKNRVDINRIIEDPPHKRKLESPTTGKKDGLVPEDANDEHNSKIKRNKTEDSHAIDQVEEEDEKSSSIKSVPPLEDRMICFRNMLLERGVSAFSTWEKELHKIVFDPRYLLLNSEERKQLTSQRVDQLQCLNVDSFVMHFIEGAEKNVVKYKKKDCQDNQDNCHKVPSIRVHKEFLLKELLNN